MDCKIWALILLFFEPVPTGLLILRKKKGNYNNVQYFAILGLCLSGLNNIKHDLGLVLQSFMDL